MIEFQNATAAIAVTYLQANFFGQGNLTGQVLTDYGKYVDELAFVEGVGWRVRDRRLVNFVSFCGVWITSWVLVGWEVGVRAVSLSGRRGSLLTKVAVSSF